MSHLRNPFTLEAVPTHRNHPCRGVREAPLAGTPAVCSLNCDSQSDSVEHRLLRHAEVFAFDMVAYATVGQHCHAVLRLNERRALAWSTQDVAERWIRLFRAPRLVRRFLRKETLTEMEQQTVVRLTTIWRRKLMDERWLARSLNRESPVRIVFYI